MPLCYDPLPRVHNRLFLLRVLHTPTLPSPQGVSIASRRSPQEHQQCARCDVGYGVKKGSQRRCWGRTLDYKSQSEAQAQDGGSQLHAWVQPRSVPSTSTVWPRCWIHLHEAYLLLVRQRKKPRCIGLESIRATGGRTTTHQHGGIGIVAKSNGLPQLVGDQVARDIGQRERIAAIALDPHQDFFPSWQAGGERNEIPLR